MPKSLISQEKMMSELITKPVRPKYRNYGKRPDGTEKGSGFLGELPIKGGGVMTEYSIDVNIDDKDMLIPSVVPTLTKKQMDHLLNGGEVTKDIADKAVKHAIERMKQNKSPFYQEGE